LQQLQQPQQTAAVLEIKRHLQHNRPTFTDSSRVTDHCTEELMMMSYTKYCTPAGRAALIVTECNLLYDIKFLNCDFKRIYFDRKSNYNNII
jgi:hypothetical protein